MDTSIIIILGIILFILIILNHISISTVSVSNTSTTTSQPSQSNCSETSYGCCPDGVNSKINYYGTNCPGYKPIPGYPVQPTPYTPYTPYIPPPPGPTPTPTKPIGGCAGTIYGCCPNNYTPKINEKGSNCIY